MHKLIALCDGHGMETAGKRTPHFPDGSFMRENEFNRAVVALLDKHLQRCGFKTLLVAPTDLDTPLSTRIALANKAKADLYVSVHANAAGTGGWHSARGIESFHFPGSVNGKRAAEIIHRHLIGGTVLPNRGVKSADFHVLRETTMPAVLVECAFMTNVEDAKLLLSDAYRAECAEELARGVCGYFGVTYVREVPTKIEPVSDQVAIVVNGKLLEQTGALKNGMTTVPIRAVAEALGASVKWDGESRTVHITN